MRYQPQGADDDEFAVVFIINPTKRKKQNKTK